MAVFTLKVSELSICGRGYMVPKALHIYYLTLYRKKGFQPLSQIDFRHTDSESFFVLFCFE